MSKTLWTIRAIDRETNKEHGRFYIPTHFFLSNLTDFLVYVATAWQLKLLELNRLGKIENTTEIYKLWLDGKIRFTLDDGKWLYFDDNGNCTVYPPEPKVGSKISSYSDILKVIARKIASLIKRETKSDEFDIKDDNMPMATRKI